MNLILEIKDAATIVLTRPHCNSTYVLMGRRSDTATFMPSKYVFPGGAWDPLDAEVPVASPLNQKDEILLSLETRMSKSSSLAVTAIRELWEETGLRISSPQVLRIIPKNWEGFYSGGGGPSLSKLKFFFRAITPPGGPKRFDARFFICDASSISDDLDNFKKASTELSDLMWVDIKKAKNLDLPRITKVVIDEILNLVNINYKIREIPFYTVGTSGPVKKLLEI